MSGHPSASRAEQVLLPFHLFCGFLKKGQKCGSARAAICAAEWRTRLFVIGRFEKQKNASASGDFSCAALLIRVGQALQPRLLDWQNPFKSDRYFLVAVTHAASLSDDHLAAASIDSNSSGYSLQQQSNHVTRNGAHSQNQPVATSK